MIVWQGQYADYDDFSTTEVFENAVDAYKAAGFLAPDGTPAAANNNLNWTIYPKRLYKTYEEWVEAQTSDDDLDDLREQAYIEVFYLPALIHKYEQGKHLDNYEKTCLGLREPVKSRDWWYNWRDDQ